MTGTQPFTTRLTSLADLGTVFGIDLAEDAGNAIEQDSPRTLPGPAPILESMVAQAADPDEETHRLTGILDELDAASATLAAIARQDGSARAAALEGLARHDALMAALREAEEAHARAQRVREEADALVAGAFTEEARAAATDVARLATRAERATAHAVEERRGAVEAVAAHSDIGRLLAERQVQEADNARKANAAAAERAGRLVTAIASIKQAIDAGSFEEASALWGTATNDFPDNAEIASLHTTIARRILAVKTAAAEDALWCARREDRRAPAAAVARFEALDVDGLPQPLAAQVFGEWARACARLCRERGIEGPLRFAPHAGRGAILAPQPQGRSYIVMSALGLGPDWRPGTIIAARQARNARPLRAR